MIRTLLYMYNNKSPQEIHFTPDEEGHNDLKKLIEEKAEEEEFNFHVSSLVG